MQDDEPSPFDPPPAVREEPVQPALFDNYSSKPAGADATSPTDKKSVFAKFLKSLRTTHKNAVLFTLCMDLDHLFEGEKIVLITESNAVLKSLTRSDNAAFISGIFAELGVAEHEVRFKEKGESNFDRALRELKENFDGTDVKLK